MAGDEEGGAGGLAGLTDKEREVLDLLIEHKTSKEFARLLGMYAEARCRAYRRPLPRDLDRGEGDRPQPVLDWGS